MKAFNTFERTAQALDGGATRRRWGVLLFAALGYGYLALLVAFLVGVALLLIDWRVYVLIWIPGGLLLLVILCLVPSVPSLDGCKVARADLPRLFDLIEEVRAGTDAARLHEVLLLSDVNAAIVDVPRFGVFGSRRSLCIGLPLLQTLPEDEFRAVLAHEFAHLARGHGRRRARVARLAMTWSLLAGGLQWSRNWAAFLVIPFFRWYAPRLQSVVERESRVDEHDADSVAARCAGTAAAGRALLRIELADTYAQREFWPALRRESASRETPPDDAIVRLVSVIDACLKHEQASAWLAALLQHRALEEDSHPSLADRLDALGIAATPERAGEVQRVLAQARGAKAAEALLEPDALQRYAIALSEQWQAANRKPWQKWYADAQALRDDRSRFDHRHPSVARVEPGSPATAAMRARARWTAVCQPPDVAIPVLEGIVRQYADASEARLLLGSLLLERGDTRVESTGAGLLEQVMVEESDFALTAALALRQYYTRHGASDEVQRCTRRQRELEAAAIAAMREQSVLRYGDTLRAYPLSAGTLETIREQLRSIPEIQRAFLVQKQTRHLRSTTTVVLAFDCRVPWHRQPAFSKSADEKVCDALMKQLVFPDTADVVLFPLKTRGRVQRRLSKLPGAEIYRKDDVLSEQRAGADYEWSTPRQRFAFLRRPAVALGGMVLGVFLLLGAGVAWLASSMPKASPVPADQRVAATSVAGDDRVVPLRQAARDRPDDAEAQLELATELLNLERSAEAVPVLQHAVQLAPNDAEAHNSLGWALMEQQRFPDARNSLQTAIRLNPEHPRAHQNLGWVFYYLEQYGESEAAFREAVRIVPDNPLVRMGLATLLADRTRFDEAQRELEEAIRLAPTEPSYRGALGQLLANRGRVDEALAVYRAALQIAPEHPRLWREIGVLEHVRGRHPAAIEAFREAERLDPATFRLDGVARKMRDASLAQRQYKG